ncbi:MAG: redoxin domain-containing protein [Planctomycetaceae bacterium]|nr:redoxin domain-containing protein [Planctomycetaceae bacterium]
MKRLLSRVFVIGTILGIGGLASVVAIAQDKTTVEPGTAINGAEVTPDSAPIPAELSKAAEALAKAVDRTEFEGAFEFMTEKGEREFTGMVLMELASFAMEAPFGGGEIPQGIKMLKEAAIDLGLDKVELPQYVPTGSPDDLEAIVKMDSEFKSKLFACLPENDRRKKVVEILSIFKEALASPMSLAVGPIEMAGDQAEVALVMKLDPAFQATAEAEGAAMPMDMEGPVLFLHFVQKERVWKFDGFNMKRTLEMVSQGLAKNSEPFVAIEELAIAGKTIADENVSLADYKDKVVLVDFWGTWCGPCVASLPELSKLHEKYEAKGFEILGVAADNSETLKAFLEKNPLAWKNVVDGETEIATQYGIEAFPTTLLIDKHGKHVATNLHGEALEKAIELLLDGKTIESINGSAEDILAAGKKRAEAEGKLVFLHFGADWCGPCKALEKWMAQPEIHELLSPVFVDVKIDMDVNYGATELMRELTSDAAGIPWYAVMNSSDAAPLITSEAESIGNIGLPGDSQSQDHLIRMFEKTGKFSKEQLELIRSSIEKAVKGFMESSK